MKLATQKLTLEKLISSPDIFSRCIPIISPEYFDPELRPLVKYITNYVGKYNAIPSIDYINAEYEAELSPRKITPTEVQATCDEIELFCQQGALYKAIMDSAADVTSGNRENFGKVFERVQKALSVSIQKDLGIDLYKDIEERLERYSITDIYEPTLISGLDAALGGGLARRQVTMFSANSGGGKSLMMSNLGVNYSKSGYHVLQLALELTEQMIDLRNIAISTGISIADWKSHIPEIVGTLKGFKQAGAGSFIFKRIPGGSSANDIRAYLKLYETEYGRKPDVLIVDYLDLMSPNGGAKNKNVYEQDKEKSEELAEIAFDYDCVCITASQQNREAVRNATPDQAVIAGGISKINTVDNYISIYMNPEMRLRGEMFLYFLKTRSSSAVGTMIQLAFNPDNLIISDKKVTAVGVISALKERTKNGSSIVFPGDDGDIEIPAELADTLTDYYETEESIDPIVQAVRKVENSTTSDELIDLSDDEEIWNHSKKKKKLRLNNESDEPSELLEFMSITQGIKR